MDERDIMVKISRINTEIEEMTDLKNKYLKMIEKISDANKYLNNSKTQARESHEELNSNYMSYEGSIVNQKVKNLQKNEDEIKDVVDSLKYEIIEEANDEVASINAKISILKDSREMYKKLLIQEGNG